MFKNKKRRKGRRFAHANGVLSSKKCMTYWFLGRGKQKGWKCRNRKIKQWETLWKSIEYSYTQYSAFQNAFRSWKNERFKLTFCCLLQRKSIYYIYQIINTNTKLKWFANFYVFPYVRIKFIISLFDIL